MAVNVAAIMGNRAAVLLFHIASPDGPPFAGVTISYLCCHGADERFTHAGGEISYFLFSAPPDKRGGGGAAAGVQAAAPRQAVEDDPDVRSYTTEIVRDLGYAVFDAADGQSALRVLADRPDIRLLFTDVGLPGGMNGRQLADEAKRRWPNIKVLFTTGYARNAIVHHGRLDAGVEVVLKPFSYSDVALKLRRVFDT
jgi:CheY-like chemotaxis protein